MRRSKLGLIFALVLGLVAAVLVWNYTQRMQVQLRQAQEEAEARARAEQVAVLVASRDLPARTQITRDMVTVIQIPQEAKHPQALTTIEEAEGKVIAYPIDSGEQVLATKFTTEKLEVGLAYVIPQGKRAVSIQVSELIGAGGMIQPGNTVDIIGIFSNDVMGKDMSTIILQNVEVLAVSQILEEEVPPTPQASTTQQVASAASQQIAGQSNNQSPRPTATPTPRGPRINPEARTVTLAVTPEEAQRLTLAETHGSLRLALRPAKDQSIVEIPEATLGTIRAPIEVPVAQITAVNISPTNARAGDTLKIEVSVRNTSNQVLKSQGPDPEYTYVQGQTFHSQNFPSQENSIRVGINFDGRPSAPFPYRWGLGGDLPPGASTTIVGYVKLTYDMQPTNFWAGLIQEPGTIIQDHQGTTLVTVVPANVAVIAVDVANVRSGPDISSSVISQLRYGTSVPILGQEKDWYRVQLPDGREGFVAAGWIVAPSNQGG